ncbi:MAG: glycosyltransferase family 2 protein [Tannerella sp.]|jgi:GT2 family glycosyltransferase|nr:glycosyltransferase family 2 protein [Tannerella sp.]
MYDCKLSVIIVPHDGNFPPEPCLYSLRASAGGQDAEIFFAHNDAPNDALRALFPEVAFAGRPRGASDVQFVNQMIAGCKGEYILLLHPDTVIGEDCLRTLCFFMDEHSGEVGAVGVKMLDGKGAFLTESRSKFPSPQTLLRKLCGRDRSAHDSGSDAANDLPDRPKRVDAISEAFILFNRDALNKTGLPDEAFPLEGAYLDILYRLSAAGYAQFYFCDERILHHGSKAARRGDENHIRAFYDSLSLFCRKYYPEAKAIPFLIRARKRYALLFEKKKKRKKIGKRRLLVFCRKDAFSEIKTVAGKILPGISHFGLWDPAKDRPAGAIADRRIRMKAYTDMAFCYPDISFDQILFVMEKMTDKSVAFHIYLSGNGQFVPYETA